jgi:hypothetical protein
VGRAEPGAFQGAWREEEGKADKRAPLVSYPGRKTKGHGDEHVWLGRAVACGPCSAERKGKRRTGWAVHSQEKEGRTGGPVACRPK